MLVLKQISSMQTSHMSSAPLLQVPVIRTFTLHSGNECTDKAL